jgi:hypothetical protein
MPDSTFLSPPRMYACAHVADARSVFLPRLLRARNPNPRVPISIRFAHPIQSTADNPIPFLRIARTRSAIPFVSDWIGKSQISCVDWIAPSGGGWIGVTRWIALRQCAAGGLNRIGFADPCFRAPPCSQYRVRVIKVLSFISLCESASRPARATLP